MQLPLLSSQLGLGGVPVQLPPGGESDPTAYFALLLAGVPVTVGQPAPLLAATPSATPAFAPVPVPTSAKLAVQPELEPEQKLEPSPGSKSLSAGKHPATGKGLPASGKPLPALLGSNPSLPEAAIALPEAPTTKVAEVQPITDQAENGPLPPGFADLGLLQGFRPQPALPAPAKGNPPAQQLPAVAASTLPPIAQAVRPGKNREQPVSEPASAPRTSTAPAPNIANLPLPRVHSERLPHEIRTEEFATPQLPLQQPAAPQHPAFEPSATPPSIAAPAAPEIELGQIIERLVENRIQSRETRSEVKLAHPDFGRVTLALNLAGQDRLGLTMPDAPAELRAAVGQAFAPPIRQEIVQAALVTDNSLLGSNDARRDQHSSGSRPHQPRANTDAAYNLQFTTTRDNGRKASGRGVLA